jgi:predicted dehydrogenase
VLATASELIEADIVDVVHVCTPNLFHLEQSQAAILAGKPVVCEKPLSMTLAEADAMFALAQSRGVPTAVPFIYRYFEAATRMHAQLRALADDSTSEGRLTRLDGAYLQDWLLAPGSTNWRVDPALGGESRVFADIGIHWCDLMEFVTGHRITRLRAKFSNLYADRPTEDTAEVDFETDLGATGRVVVSQVAVGHQNSLEFSFQAEEAGFGATQGANSPIAWKQADSNDYQPAFNRFMADAYASFEGAIKPNLPTFADGRRAASLIDAVVRSARTGEWVTPL